MLGIGLGLLIVPRFAWPAANASPALWCAISSAAFGALVGAGSREFGGRQAVAFASCAAVTGPIALALDPGLLSALAAPWGAVGALSGLGLSGAALGAWAARSGLSGFAVAAWLLLLSLLGHGAAAGWGLMGEAPAFGPGLTALLLDVSPHGFVLECGGVDWMRGPGLYEPAGTDRIGPGLRASWSGSVAAPLLVVVGCVALLAARTRACR